MSTPSALANFAVAVSDAVAAARTTAYSYKFSADGSITQPADSLQGADGVPMISLGGDAGAYAFTDCSGWVSFALDSVAPVHQAVAAAARTALAFNQGAIATADHKAVLLEEAKEWGWARADVLANLFDHATGQNGFTKIASFADLQPGDLIAYALGIYAKPEGDTTADAGLTKAADTGHTMIVVDTPHLVTGPDALDGSHHASPDVVAVYAVPVVDSSSLRHFTTPEPDGRNYQVPAGTPSWLDAKNGGLGTGTIWFGVDSGGKVIQFRFDAGDNWNPAPAGADTETLLVTAARLTGTIDLSSARLENGKLLVRVYPNASTTLGGTSYAVPEVITGQGGLLVTGGGTLSLGIGNSFTGETEVTSGTTLVLAADDSLGAAGNRLVLDDGATLRLGSTMVIDHAVALAGGATLDLSGNLVRFTGALSGTGTGLLTLSSTTAGGELKLNDRLAGIAGIRVQGGAALTFTSNGGTPGMVQLQEGATLNVHALASLATLTVSGAARLDLEGGATLTVMDEIAPLAGAPAFGTLTVSGSGSLVLEAHGVVRATVAAGHTVFTGTLAQFSGQILTGYKPGDLIDVSDLLPTAGPNGQTIGVTATYDNETGRLTVTRGDQTGLLQLTAGLTTPTSDGTQYEFTVRTDGLGGSLLATATAAGNQDSVALRATQARAAGMLDGKGVTVGVISVSFNTYGGMAQDILNGYLPQDTQILSEAPAANSDEGREMARIIHNIAPGAAIRFAYAYGTTSATVQPGQDIADAIRNLVDHGANVIVDDVSVFGDRVYQQGGVVADAIAYAHSKGVTLVTSASNVGKNYYEHTFALTQTDSLPGGTTYAFDFGRGAKPFMQEVDLAPTPYDSVAVTLAWDQPAQHSSYALSLKVYTFDGTNYHEATNVSESAPYALDPAVRTITISDISQGGNYYFAVTSEDGASGTFKYIIHHEGDGTVIQDPGANVGSGAMFGHALNPQEITVGAVDWRAAPAYGLIPFANEAFSAPGKGQYLIDADGNRITNPPLLGKPDVSGIDGTVDDVSGMTSGFHGTSAAAPSVAGVAALILAANKDLTPDQVKAVLQASAIDMNDETVAGAGLVQADKAVELARTPVITAITATPDLAGVPLRVGNAITLTLTASAAMVVTTTAGVPTLTLDDGGIAVFDAAASTGTSLVFRAIVAAGQDTNALTVVGLSLNGAGIANRAGLPLSTGPLGAIAGSVTGLAVDTSAPAVTLLLDTTTSAGLLTGITEPGATLTLSAATGTLGTTTAKPDGRWTFPLTGLPDGSNLVTATATDAAGNSGSAQLPITVANGSAGSTRVAGTGETLVAGTGPDTLIAGGAGVHLVGGTGRTQLVGAISGASTLTGGSGGTVFASRGGATLIEGGSGRDTIHAASGDVTVVSGTSGSLIGLGIGSALVNGRGPDTIIGGAGAATIGSGVNSLVALGAGTALVSAGSATTVVGGSGAVLVGVRGTGATFFGGSGDAVFIGGAGNSLVVGGAGSATLFGGQGGGVFAGGAKGHNVMVGGQGATTLFGGGDGDALFAAGPAGTMLVAGSGNETLQGAGSSGNDVFFAGAGSTLIGLGSGQDTVVAGSGSSTVVAGAGAETFAVVKGQAGGSLGVFGFKLGTDHVSLAGFAPGEATRAMAGAIEGVDGTTVTLSDNTRISFMGVHGLGTDLFA